MPKGIPHSDPEQCRQTTSPPLARLYLEDLPAKLRRYVDLRRCWRDYWRAGDWERARLPNWPSRYRDLPSLLVVFADSDRGNPEQHMGLS